MFYILPSGPYISDRYESEQAVTMAGEPVSVVILGGSITCGGDTRELGEVWWYRVFNWINATYPHEDHTYHNLCKSATPTMVAGACLQNELPKAIDLILVEVSSYLIS